METIEKSIEINVPVKTAYNQWTQFEQFPRFMDGVKEVKQIDDTHLHWKAEIAGMEKEWDSEITEQIPDSKIAWKSGGGDYNRGTVNFQAIDSQHTKVLLQIDHEPENIIEKIGDMVGITGMKVEGDLKRFKEFIEDRRFETGAWRGQVQ